MMSSFHDDHPDADEITPFITHMYFQTSLLGTSHYQAALKEIAGGVNLKETVKIHTAALILDDENEHDPNAVRVEIDDRVVGHLPGDMCEQYREMVAVYGDEPVWCAAKLDGTSRRYGVKINIDSRNPRLRFDHERLSYTEAAEFLKDISSDYAAWKFGREKDDFLKEPDNKSESAPSGCTCLVMIVLAVVIFGALSG